MIDFLVRTSKVTMLLSSWIFMITMAAVAIAVVHTHCVAPPPVRGPSMLAGAFATMYVIYGMLTACGRCIRALTLSLGGLFELLWESNSIWFAYAVIPAATFGLCKLACAIWPQDATGRAHVFTLTIVLAWCVHRLVLLVLAWRANDLLSALLRR